MALISTTPRLDRASIIRFGDHSYAISSLLYLNTPADWPPGVEALYPPICLFFRLSNHLDITNFRASNDGPLPSLQPIHHQKYCREGAISVIGPSRTSNDCLPPGGPRSYANWRPTTCHQHGPRTVPRIAHRAPYWLEITPIFISTF